jgi:hypothetical protein
LVGVVPEVESVSLLVGVYVEGGEGAEDLLEGEEGGGAGQHQVLHQLLARHPADLITQGDEQLVKV